MREVRLALRTGTRHWTRARPLAFVIAALTALSAALSASAPPAAAASFVPISGAGSTWSDNAITDWATNVAQFGMKVNYEPLGSASGRQNFAEGLADFGAPAPGIVLGLVSLGTGVTLGSTVAVPPGLGTTAAVLASAPAGSGFGTSVLGANLFLLVPPTARPGIYTSTLSVTVVAAQP